MRLRLDDSIDMAAQPSLFGCDRQAGMVGNSWTKEGDLKIHRRVEGQIELQAVTDFKPFIWLSEADLLESCPVEHETIPLAGENFYTLLVRAQSWPDCRAITEHIKSACGLYPSHPDSPQVFINDLPTQYLLASGQTYYNGMGLDDIHSLTMRVYLEGPRIVAVGLYANWSDEFFLIDDPDEDKLLYHLSGKIRKLDPDTIGGHDLFNRDLSLIKERAKKLKVKLAWGREKETLYGRKTRMMVAEKQLDYRRFRVSGREFVDSWILSILHDVSKREMVGFGLEEVLAHFDLSPQASNGGLAKKAEMECRAIAKLHRSLLYPYFLQSQLFPLSFENVILRGNATRINHLFLREYYRQRHSIPLKPEMTGFAGGLTACEHAGPAYGVFHCDVASLYPSLIVTHDLGPDTDELGIYTGMLRSLRDFRLEVKAKLKNSSEDKESEFLDNLQDTFKILINSFYGYLGFAQGHFGDFQQAAEVTRLGRQLLTDMMAWLKSKDAKILEVDTDGIYFVPSPHFRDPDWLRELNQQFPEGVQVEFDGRYPAMYCHKMKNYALLDNEGKLVLRGSGLRSRAIEPYLREFIERLIETTLKEDLSRQEVLAEFEDRLKSGDIPVSALAKTETLIHSPKNYAKKVESGSRNRAAVYELALQSQSDHKAGDSLCYYVTGEKATVTVYDHCRLLEDWTAEEADHNIKYYLKKLKQTFKKFDPSLGLESLACEVNFQDLPDPS